jgi:hypothetical protein
MLMPKTSMNKDDGPVARQHDIWRAREMVLMKPEAVSKRMEEPSHSYFRPSVLLPNVPHDVRALGR